MDDFGCVFGVVGEGLFLGSKMMGYEGRFSSRSRGEKSVANNVYI